MNLSCIFLENFSNLTKQLFSPDGVVELGTDHLRIADCILPDKYEENNQIETLKIPQRNSIDRTSDGRGKEFLDLCKSIINGRKVGDPFGSPTLFQRNVNNIVNYMITTQSLFAQIITFKVGEYKPCISDTSALHYFLRIKMPLCDHMSGLTKSKNTVNDTCHGRMAQITNLDRALLVKRF